MILLRFYASKFKYFKIKGNVVLFSNQKYKNYTSNFNHLRKYFSFLAPEIKIVGE